VTISVSSMICPGSGEEVGGERSRSGDGALSRGGELWTTAKLSIREMHKVTPLSSPSAKLPWLRPLLERRGLCSSPSGTGSMDSARGESNKNEYQYSLSMQEGSSCAITRWPWRSKKPLEIHLLALGHAQNDK
jgi:hypothetical protein